jgi:hypothetical protein
MTVDDDGLYSLENGTIERTFLWKQMYAIIDFLDIIHGPVLK